MLGCTDCQLAIKELCTIKDALTDDDLSALSKLVAVGLVVDSLLARLAGIPAVGPKGMQWAETKFIGVRITYVGNTVSVNQFRTREENERHAKDMMTSIMGYDPWRRKVGNRSQFDIGNGKIEYYHEH